jgi:hypothetical protein
MEARVARLNSALSNITARDKELHATGCAAHIGANVVTSCCRWFAFHFAPLAGAMLDKSLNEASFRSHIVPHQAGVGKQQSNAHVAGKVVPLDTPRMTRRFDRFSRRAQTGRRHLPALHIACMPLVPLLGDC